MMYREARMNEGEATMQSLTAWMVSLTVSICVILIAAGANNAMLHMAASGAVSLIFAVLAVRDHAILSSGGAPKGEIAASTARYCGLVWGWGALGIMATYGLILEGRWPEWVQFFAGFAVVAAACLLFSLLIAEDSAKDTANEPVIKLGRALVIMQFIGMIAALISLLVDGKFPRAVSHPDWAASNIFFFGALAIAAISLNALLAPSSKKN